MDGLVVGDEAMWPLDRPAGARHPRTGRDAHSYIGRASAAAARPRIRRMREVGCAKQRLGYANYVPRISTAISATWVGVRPTRTPRDSSASILACAPPLEPETIAPAWPIVLPGGAVTPARKTTAPLWPIVLPGGAVTPAM